ncbi:hypothetical protein ACE6H2_011536 [Prunus campanulata]
MIKRSPLNGFSVPLYPILALVSYSLHYKVSKIGSIFVSTCSYSAYFQFLLTAAGF